MSLFTVSSVLREGRRLISETANANSSTLVAVPPSLLKTLEKPPLKLKVLEYFEAFGGGRREGEREGGTGRERGQERERERREGGPRQKGTEIDKGEGERGGTKNNNTHTHTHTHTHTLLVRTANTLYK